MRGFLAEFGLLYLIILVRQTGALGGRFVKCDLA